MTSAEAVEGADILTKLVSATEMGRKKGKTPLPENESVDLERIITLRKGGSDQVREMQS